MEGDLQEIKEKLESFVDEYSEYNCVKNIYLSIENENVRTKNIFLSIQISI